MNRFVLTFENSRIKVDEKTAKENLSEHEFHLLLKKVYESNERPLNHDEIETIANLAEKVHRKLFEKELKRLKIMTYTLISVLIAFIILSIIGAIWAPALLDAMDYVAMIFNLTLAIMLIFYKERNRDTWKAQKKRYRVFWWFAFMLNVVFFAEGLVDIIPYDFMKFMS